MKQESTTLLAVFSGIWQGFGVPLFEFKRTLRRFDCDKIFFMDRSKRWYLESLDAIKETLSNDRKKYERIITIGNSMGGFAAILFGAMIDADKVLAFSPQTFIDRHNRRKHEDTRWRKEIRNTRRTCSEHKECFDLAQYLKQLEYSTAIEIYYSRLNRNDRAHADHIKTTKGVRLRAIPHAGHGTAKALRESEKLSGIIEAEIVQGGGVISSLRRS